MDTEEQNSLPAEKPSAAPKSSSDITLKPKKSAKPLLEGINAPASATSPTVSSQNSPAPTISLTNSERQLINDPNLGKTKPAEEVKILPQEWQPQGASSWKKALVGLMVIVVVIVGVVGGYVWYLTHAKSDTVEVKKPIVKVTQNTPVAAGPEVVETPVATSSPATSTPVTAAPKVDQVKVTDTPTGFLNVRSTPSTSGALVTKVYPGETYVFTETKDGWYHITLSDGTAGWVIGTYVSKVK